MHYISRVCELEKPYIPKPATKVTTFKHLMLCAAGVSYKSLLVPLMVDGGIATSYADEYILDLVVDRSF